ncbi:PC-esterase domain-containing protein 1B [Choloepus didactylus]|uniref:PC-esterase domain-containing protein 1B n=1 Tax=Choloepus didactylus TaxID=27675 RepID=UPI0018A00E74|nr:PC-esterase domain-containing protein 1B [Choloepus didactylus]XP_037701826.1 PC-esterase domain-containing protein 1B [Choloepus didactylus]XP_037701827.1 PC-esterase domain-containing protein 1B [Choloepus didactylus]XP_037701828.1 PC-esterase domain-containing protein 1B [Choloepus didactylus]XP_037701829.1 PC-esterase domain-containing protein 1B [Choloepus didactylus]XP_037701831.1 PC-esterase domain-containing protein 1B [Choloepus didactylus]
MVYLRASEVQQLLHNKFVVILGDSVQRAVYKDLVLLLQKDCLLTTKQLKAKGEMSFEQDELVEGGKKGHMHNGTQYREVRQFCTGHHLVRFYFLTRVYSDYLEAILEELRSGEHAPDVVIMNSCLWDISRYGQDPWRSYRENLERLFGRLDQVLPDSCLLVWNTAMPVGKKITGGFLPPENQSCAASLPGDVLEANFYSYAEARKHGFDVLDLHFYFRRAERHRQVDGVHWDEHAHRHLSQLLLAHVADAWGVELPSRNPVGNLITEGPVRARRALGVKRQPQAGRDQLALPLHPLLPLPGPPLLPPPPLPWPPPPPPPPPVSFPFPHPHPRPLCHATSQFPPSPQDACFFSDQPLQSDQFSDCFHLDVPSSSQTGFFIQAESTFNPQPPMASFCAPYQQRARVIHRGFPQYPHRGPYVPRRGRPRPSKRLAPAHPESSPR